MFDKSVAFFSFLFLFFTVALLEADSTRVQGWILEGAGRATAPPKFFGNIDFTPLCFKILRKKTP